MREIKFRGKRKDNGEWVKGAYSWGFSVSRQFQYRTIVSLAGCNCIEVYEVDPATVGQFVGLHDKNGREIYEGDVIQMPHIKAEGYDIDENGMWKSVVVCGKDGRWESHNGMGFRFAYGVEIIGSIHEKV